MGPTPAPVNFPGLPHAENHHALGTSDVRARSLGWLSLKGDDVTSGAVGLEGLRHADQLANLRGSNT